MIKRTLQEINTEIQSHRDAIKLLEKEIKDFQAACPHPDQFQQIVRKTTDDEYGRIDGYTIKTTCLLCGHGTFRTEDVQTGKYS